MSEVGPSTRFRSTALTVLAAGGVFLPVIALAAGSLGLLPGSGPEPPPSSLVNDEATIASYGASGILPQTTALSATLLASITDAGNQEAAAGIPEGALEIPPVALTAYRRAEETMALRNPNCGLTWPLLAGLARVISDHGSGEFDAAGTTTNPILGPRLNGSAGLATIPDTDGGVLDGDQEWDRAAGPLQVIPTVWSRIGSDSDGDGTANPHNIFDASLGAARYLCEGGRANLTSGPEQARAVFRYQRSEVFVRAVMAWTFAYQVRLAEPAQPAPPPPLPVEQIELAETPAPPARIPAGDPKPPASAIPQPGTPPPPAPGPGPTTPPPPGTPTTTPSDPTTTPSDPTTTPSDPTTTPSDPTTTPSDPTTTPTDPTTTPTDPTTTPTDPTTTTGTTTSDPPITEPVEP